VKVWEAVQASNSAPLYFPPLELDCDGQQLLLMDGALLNNNPVEVAFHEASLLWPEDNIALIVSIGTGTTETSNQENGKGTVLDLVDILVTIVTATSEKMEQFCRWLMVIGSKAEAIRIDPPGAGAIHADSTYPPDWKFSISQTQKFLCSSKGVRLIDLVVTRLIKNGKQEIGS